MSFNIIGQRKLCSEWMALLQELSLAGNRLTTLPDAIGNLSSLQRLQMAGNLLTSLPDSICRLTDLEVSCDCVTGWLSRRKVSEPAERDLLRA